MLKTKGTALVDPPRHAIVLSLDEKSQVQAWRSAPTTEVGAGSQPRDRTQPGLPMKPGRAGTMTHLLCCMAPKIHIFIA